MKSHVACWLIYQLTCATTSALQTRNSALSFEIEYQQLHQIQELCYYSENKAKIVLSFSLTAIKYFHAKLHPTNICSVTGRLFVGIIQARCFCCLLDNNFRIFSRYLCVFACFDRKISAFFFFKYSITRCKSISLSIKYCGVELRDLRMSQQHFDQ